MLEENKYQRFVSVLLFDGHGEEVALLRKQRPDFLKGKLMPIGGKIEENETPTQAILRELREEANLNLEEKDLVNFAFLRGDSFDISFYYNFSDSIFRIESLTDEKIDRFYVTFLETLDVGPDVSWLIPMALSIKNKKESVDFYIVQK